MDNGSEQDISLDVCGGEKKNSRQNFSTLAFEYFIRMSFGAAQLSGEHKQRQVQQAGGLSRRGTTKGVGVEECAV